jgi:hypothetical protein
LQAEYKEFLEAAGPQHSLGQVVVSEPTDQPDDQVGDAGVPSAFTGHEHESLLGGVASDAKGLDSEAAGEPVGDDGVAVMPSAGRVIAAGETVSLRLVQRASRRSRRCAT